MIHWTVTTGKRRLRKVSWKRFEGHVIKPKS